MRANTDLRDQVSANMEERALWCACGASACGSNLSVAARPGDPARRKATWRTGPPQPTSTAGRLPPESWLSPWRQMGPGEVAWDVDSYNLPHGEEVAAVLIYVPGREGAVPAAVPAPPNRPTLLQTAVGRVDFMRQPTSTRKTGGGVNAGPPTAPGSADSASVPRLAAIRGNAMLDWLKDNQPALTMIGAVIAAIATPSAGMPSRRRRVLARIALAGEQHGLSGSAGRLPGQRAVDEMADDVGPRPVPQGQVAHRARRSFVSGGSPPRPPRGGRGRR